MSEYRKRGEFFASSGNNVYLRTLKNRLGGSKEIRMLFFFAPRLSKSKKMEYYISADNEKRGPYSLRELAGRKLQATTLVMPDDGTQWIPAWQIKELRTLLEESEHSDRKPDVEGVPFVEASPVTPSAGTAPAGRPSKKSHAGCLAGGLVVLAAVLFVLVLTCPKPEQHREVLADVITATVTDAANDTANTTGNEVIDNAFRTISNVFAGKVIRSAIDDLVTVDNYVVCSLGKVHYNGKDYIVSLGLLGHIFTVDEDDLRKAAEQYYKKSEINVKEQLKQKAQKMIQENVVDPAATAIKGILGGALDGLLDDIGLGMRHPKDDRGRQPSTDSI